MEQELLDPLLIEKIRDGDNQAFKIIRDRLYDRLAAMARKLVSRSEDAEDAIAHGFLQLFVHREKMESLNHIEGFLHDTVRHKCQDILLKDQRRKKLWELRPPWVARSEQTARENEADYKVLGAELAYFLWAEVGKLPTHLRMAYRLTVLEKVPVKEVAVQLGVSERTVRTYVNQAAEELYAIAVRKGLHILLILCLLKLLVEKI
jgi:RNA polymerase sigma-70 factor (ECF subfamily)